MNTTKNLLLAAGIVLQLSGSIFADAWSDAFREFSTLSDPVAAANYVYNNRGTMSFSKNQKTAKALKNTPEALAVGLYMSEGNPSVLLPKFKGAASLSDLDMALKGAISNSRSSIDNGYVGMDNGSVGMIDVSAEMIDLQNQLTEAQAAVANAEAQAQELFNRLQQAEQAILDAQQVQQQADAAVLGQNNQAINDALNSDQEDVNLFKNLIDISFGNIERGINSADLSIRAELQGYVKSKANSLQVVSSASNKSRILGRSSSKKSNKKSRK